MAEAAKNLFVSVLTRWNAHVERRAQLVAHAGDELRLVLACLRQLPILVLNLLEQPHILNGNHRLVANVDTSSICFSVNGRTVTLAKLNTPIGTPSRISGTPRMVRTPPLRSIAQRVQLAVPPLCRAAPSKLRFASGIPMMHLAQTIGSDGVRSSVRWPT